MKHPTARPSLLLILAPLAALLVAACASTDTKSLQEGFKLYTDQHPEQSEAAADRFIAANPDAPEIDQAYYLRGISRLTRGNRIAAASDLRTAISKTTRADLRSKSYRALGDLAYDQQQWPDALRAYQSALDNLTLDPTVANYCNYRVGATLQAQGEWTRALPWFTKVADANLDPALTDRARRRKYATSFSLQFGAFQDTNAAQSLSTKLRSASIAAAVITESRSDNKLWYLVQSGNYPNYAQATLARDRILAQYPNATIVP